MSSVTDWNIKFAPRQIVTLARRDGQNIDVEIEGVHIYKTTGIIYDVREVETRIGYTADQRDLTAKARVRA